MPLKKLIAELKRRNVFRVAFFYLASGWLILQVADVLLEIIEAPAGSLRLIALVLAIGFPFALILAWAFEITPEGVRRETDLKARPTPPAWSVRRLDIATIAVTTVAVALLVWVSLDRSSREEAATEVPATAVQPDLSIAVLPFVNMSPDAEHGYFADGISEELLNVLARVPQLRVISRSSAFSFKDQNVEAPEIARRLNVAHILEGSVRSSGDRIRVTAQLIDARSDSHLWSETFDRSLDDIFSIQDEIAQAVVAQLKITLLGEAPKVAETDPQAYALYLQGRELSSRGSTETDEQAIALMEQVLAIDPEYAPAWDGLSGIYANQASRGSRPYDEGFELSREMARKALELDPEYAPAWAGLGWVAMVYDNDLPAAARHFERALELAPTSLKVLSNSAVLLQSLGRLEQAITLDEIINARDPISSSGHYNVGYYYLAAGRLDEAITSYRTALQLSPGRIGAHYFIGTALLYQGDARAGLEEMEQEPHEVLRLLGRVIAHHALGQAAESDAALEQLIEAHAEGWAYYIASVLAFRNEPDAVFEWLARAVENRSPGLPGIIINPLFASVHDDPRWLPFLESIGKAPAQLDAIEFRVRLPEQVSY